MPALPARTRSYAASGVDLAARARALGRLLRAARYRAPSSHGRPIAAPGHYAGLVRIARETIAITTDTVGTKVLLAEQVGRWEEVGEDLVAVNVNDLAAVGARPAAVVDTVLCGSADGDLFEGIGRGIARGLAAARCSLVGGETALVGEVVRGIDLGATAVGFFPARRRPVLGNGIRPGDRLLGLPASGLHANGFTLVRRLLREAKVRLDVPRAGSSRPLGRELLTPTRTYSELVDAVADLRTVVGLAHISGGGVRNLTRLSSRVRFVLDAWPAVPSLFSWVQQLGGLSDREMFQTFNMGVGFVLVVRPDAEAAVRRRLLRAGSPGAPVVGHVTRGRGVEVVTHGLRYGGYD
jgi:phosphoribosylformylglycinamidine cyclo-ligase